MSSVIEMLASKKKPGAPPEAVILPMLGKEHSGDCGDGCGCGSSEGGCCGG